MEAPLTTSGSGNFLRHEMVVHVAGVLALAAASTVVLFWFSSAGQIADAARFLLNDRRVPTVVVGVLMALLIGTGVVLLARVGRVEAEIRPRGTVWAGRLLIWVTVLTPLLVGAMWWAFFSAGQE